MAEPHADFDSIIVAVARIEEKLNHIADAIENHTDTIGDISNRLRLVENNLIRREAIERRFERFIWLIIGAIVSLSVGLILTWFRASMTV